MTAACTLPRLKCGFYRHFGRPLPSSRVFLGSKIVPSQQREKDIIRVRRRHDLSTYCSCSRYSVIPFQSRDLVNITDTFRHSLQHQNAAYYYFSRGKRVPLYQSCRRGRKAATSLHSDIQKIQSVKSGASKNWGTAPTEKPLVNRPRSPTSA